MWLWCSQSIEKGEEITSHGKLSREWILFLLLFQEARRYHKVQVCSTCWTRAQDGTRTKNGKLFCQETKSKVSIVIVAAKMNGDIGLSSFALLSVLDCLFSATLEAIWKVLIHSYRSEVSLKRVVTRQTAERRSLSMSSHRKRVQGVWLVW